MRWFRLHQKWGTCFALAALMIQLVVASAHVHLDPSDRQHGNHLAHVESHAGDAAISAVAHEPDAPGDQHSHHQDQCAACTLIHLAQSLLAPNVPTLALPDAIERQPASRPAIGLATPDTALFRARAPPFA
ncbi:MAG: DUF2946 family protein [Xanthobacteraceae bacterium]